jgi:hypothetical protein
VFGENPSVFAGLFVKKASLGLLERSTVARSIVIVDIVPARRWSLHDKYCTDFDSSLTSPKLAERCRKRRSTSTPPHLPRPAQRVRHRSQDRRD